MAVAKLEIRVCGTDPLLKGPPQNLRFGAGPPRTTGMELAVTRLYLTDHLKWHRDAENCCRQPCLQMVAYIRMHAFRITRKPQELLERRPAEKP